MSGISIPLFGSQVKNKHHLHSRHLASYLGYKPEGVYQYMYIRETGISETNLLIVGQVGETIASV